MVTPASKVLSLSLHKIRLSLPTVEEMLAERLTRPVARIVSVASPPADFTRSAPDTQSMVPTTSLITLVPLLSVV